MASAYRVSQQENDIALFTRQAHQRGSIIIYEQFNRIEDVLSYSAPIVVLNQWHNLAWA